MKFYMPVVLLLVFVAAASAAPVDDKDKIAAQPPEPPPAAAAAVDGSWADNDKATALVGEYLRRLDFPYTQEASQGYPLLKVKAKRANATHHLHIVIDGPRQMVYLFLNRYLTVKPDDPALPKVLQRLMQENWNLNIGKFEWDKTDGEIRFSYCFTTENGVGFEAFGAIVKTLLETGDKFWPELHALTGP
jgi:hypothetical protein